MSGANLRQYLLGKKYDKISLSVPNGVKNAVVDPSSLSFENSGIKAKAVLTEKDRISAADFMATTFYRHGLVPKALRLDREKHGIVDKELDLHLKTSNVSQIFTNESGEVVSVMLSVLWPADRGYEWFDVDPLEWLNVAGQIAGGCAETWRNFQYQLIYHVFQGEARRKNREFVFYSSMQFVAEEARRSNLGFATVLNLNRNVPRNSCCLCFLGTFLSKIGETGLDVLHHVPYQSLTFANEEGEKVFGDYRNDRQGGLSFVTRV